MTSVRELIGAATGGVNISALICSAISGYRNRHPERIGILNYFDMASIILMEKAGKKLAGLFYNIQVKDSKSAFRIHQYLPDF
jgi:hypothetical protein